VATWLAAALRAADLRWRLAHWYWLANTASASAIASRPGHQEHHADGEDRRARDPAQQPDQIVLICSMPAH
jgi:hypothetical protein